MKSVVFAQICLIGVLSLPFVVNQQQPKFLSCASKEKCDECIRTFGCVWCSDPNFKDRRCSKAGETRCLERFIMNPKNEPIILQSNPLSAVRKPGSGGLLSGSGLSSQENVVQISPQHLKLKLRPNEGNPLRFTMKYRQAVDYPVDLYYLMDLSNSMSDDKDKLSSLGTLLSDTMSNITSDFRLGFGSFVDKVVMPYVSIVPKRLKQPCDEEIKCVAPYGFRNDMPLSSGSNFSGQVKSSSVSGNLDAPEGGFDAIMQAIVCKNQIGWRDQSRKLLVFSTDSSFHFAGDGKLGGIIKPNDGCCHLDETGLYTHSTIQDYPSVSQINMKVKENSINVIFAVTQEQVNLYKQLGNHIEGSSYGELSSDSGNVVDLVKAQYDKITSSVEIKEKEVVDGLTLKYYSRCLNVNGPLVPTNRCDGLKVGQTVEFEIDVELKACPTDRDKWNTKFDIYRVPLGSESLTVDVEMQCDCDCQHPDHPSYEKDSPRCSGHGTLKCGICYCDAGFSDEDCSCTSEVADKTDKCHPDGVTQFCSKRGICKCNKCVCESLGNGNESFYGDFCECNNFNCPRIGGKLCSGRGDCVCGKCACEAGWIGEDCACEDSKSNCIIGGEECSGHGTCKCNKCVCEPNKGFSGKYCEKCPQCPNKCAELRDCVQCKVHNSGPYTKEQCDACNVTIDVVEFLQLNENEDYNFCSYYDDQDCRFTYNYELRGKEIHVIAQQNKECPPSSRILGVVFSVILSIVLIGLAFLLMWKFITSMRDRREFAKFEKERMMAKWDSGQNPIYKQATSTFKNPTYCGS